MPDETGYAPILHWWVTTHPHLSTELFFAGGCGAVLPALLRLFDPDGELINEAEITAPENGLAVVELEPFLGACKLHSGFKHAHLEVRPPRAARPFARLRAHEAVTVVGPSAPLSAHHMAFFPLTLGSGRTHLVSFVETSGRRVDVRGRLLVGRHAVDAEWSIAPHGAAVVSPQVELLNTAAEGYGKNCPAYLRLAVKGEGTAAAQVVEQVEQNGRLTSLNAVSS